jgi:two-component system alkaline phosphatase synthesis response regulator PhoP
LDAVLNKKILIVDDEEDILELVQYNLEQNGFLTETAVTGETGLKKARANNPDLIILDLMLPGIGGLDICRLLKSDPNTKAVPIVMLTAKGEEADVVRGLELGADDYVTKPFSPKVLVARIKSVLRRNTVPDESGQDKLQHHDIIINLGKRLVTVGGKAVELTFSEYEILHYLLRRPGWVFTRNEIVDRVHGDNYPVTDRSVDVQIVGLRKKLGRAGKYIQTVRGVGYRLVE